MNGYGLWMDPVVFGRKEVLTLFQRERSKNDVLSVLATPDVAWVGWKLDGGLTVGLWSLNPDESVRRLTSFLEEKPTGRTMSVASWHRDSPPSYLDWVVIDALIDDPRSPFESLVDSTGLSPKTVRKHLKRVFESGLAMVMPRQGAIEGSGELVYHLAVGGDVTEKEIRAVIQDATLLHQTERPPMRYLLCRGIDLAEVTTSTNALRRLPSVKSAIVTLNRDTFCSHSSSNIRWCENR